MRSKNVLEVGRSRVSHLGAYAFFFEARFSFAIHSLSLNSGCSIPEVLAATFLKLRIKEITELQVISPQLNIKFKFLLGCNCCHIFL